MGLISQTRATTSQLCGLSGHDDLCGLSDPDWQPLAENHSCHQRLQHLVFATLPWRHLESTYVRAYTGEVHLRVIWEPEFY